MPRRAELKPLEQNGKWTLNVPPKFSPNGKRMRLTFPSRDLAEERVALLKIIEENSPSAAAMLDLAELIRDHPERFGAGFSTLRPIESSLPPEGAVSSKVKIPGWVEKEADPWLKAGLTPHDIWDALRIFALYRKNLTLDPIEAIEDRAQQLVDEIQLFIQLGASDVERAVIALRDLGLAAARLLERVQRSSHDKLTAALLKVAHESGSWPISVSAIEELRRDTLDHVQQLDLGKSLPFRTTAHRGRPGHPRSMVDGQAAFALEVAVALQNARSAEAVSRSTTGHQREPFAWRDGSWERLASRLPEFDGNPATQKKWLEAGMLLLEATCKGKWDTYEWPARIRNALAYKSGGDASPKRPKSVLKTALKEGLKTLVKP